MSLQLLAKKKKHQARLKSMEAAVEKRKRSYNTLITQITRGGGEKMVWMPTKWLQSWITGEPLQV